MEKIPLIKSVWFRLIIVGVLTLLLLIPASMILSLIHERQDRYNNVFHEIASKWGEEQTVSGPVLSVPYTVEIQRPENKIEKVTKYLHILPEELQITTKIYPQMRYRGIFEIVVFNADIEMSGNFTPGEVKIANEDHYDLRWDEAFVSFSVSDMTGIKNLIELNWNGEMLAMDPGIITRDVFGSGISKKIGSYDPTERSEFSIHLNLNGSSNLYFTPLGKETRVDMTSDWSEPSFTGSFLPEGREISEEGFSAWWEIFHLNRSFPQMWVGPLQSLDDSKFGVKLLVPVNEYQKTMRTAKYAAMIISLTFLTFFMIELLNGKAIHPIQYLLTGFALIVFYTLLLSFAEHLGFHAAYAISSVATIALIVMYLKSIFRSLTHTIIVGGILVLLYGYMFFVLQLQDYALMVGSIGLFVILATVMYLTRKIDWAKGMQTRADK